MNELHKQIVDCIPGLRRYSRALTGGGDLADDLVQDCLARAMDRLHLFKPGSNMRAWLFSILHNQHVNNVRRSAVRPDAADLEAVVEERTGVPANQEQNLEIRDIRAGLALLPDDQRQVILLVGLEGMSYVEAAEILGIPKGTVMSRLNRGREQLRTLMNSGSRPEIRRVK